jgi:NADH-quinone oxidoreductase subunit K
MLKHLLFSSLLLLIGLLGLAFIRRHVILIIIFGELIFLASSFNFLIFSVFLDDVAGQIYCLFLLAVAAADTALGLSFIILFYRIKGDISVNMLNSLKG